MDGKDVTLPTLQMRLQVAREHFALLRQEKGDVVGIREARRQISLYFHGINGAASIRDAFFRAETAENFETVFNRIETMCK
jgi:tRNA-dihydrouridine synthase